MSTAPATAAANESAIYGFLKAHGLTAPQIAGVLGNLQQESGFSPTALGRNDGGPGVDSLGIVQWEGGRRANLQQYAAAHGSSETDLNMQLGYFWQELTGSYPSVYADLLRASDPATAATLIDASYEVSDGKSRGTRIGYAQSIYQSIQAGSLKPGAAGASGGLPAAIGNMNGAALSAVGSGSAGLAGGPGSSWTDALPWNWGKDIGSIVNAVLAFVMKMGFVGGGLVLVVLGAYRASGPVREKAAQGATAIGVA